MTLQQLSDAWNKLRNAALGRGATALVSSELADAVAQGHEDFRAWLSAQGPVDELLLRAWDSAELAPWVERYNALREQVAAEGRPVPGALAEPTSIAAQVGSGAKAIAFAAALGVGVAVFLNMRRGRRG